MERRILKHIIFRILGPSAPETSDQRAMRQLVDSLSPQQADMIRERILLGKSWTRLADELFYSERQLRNILNEALDSLDQRIIAAVEAGQFSQAFIEIYNAD